MINSNVLVSDIDSLSYSEWLQVRRSGLGGSDAAAALGLSPWKSPLELWEEKVMGKTQPHQENESMIWGKLLEPVVREEFSRRTGLKVSPLRSMLQAPQMPWMLANVDAIIEDPLKGTGVLEIKTTGAFRGGEWSEDRCPDMYSLQIAHYLAVTGLDYAVLCVLVGGNELRWATVQRDDELITSLVDLERIFWERVLTKTPPPVDGSAACAELLSRRYPVSNNTAPLILPAEADCWITDYLEAKAEEDSATDKKRLAENRIKEAMQEHEKSISPGGNQVTWKTIQACRMDTTRLKTEEPALFEKFSTTSSTRRFSISKPK